jgi:hypothetical protein
MVKDNMKRKLLILLAAIVALTTPLVPQSQALGFSISVGDRPYYHGGGYWHEGYYWVWVPGHYSRSWGRWVPGHYARRGGYNGAYARTHYRYHRVWINDRDWR